MDIEENEVKEFSVVIATVVKVFMPAESEDSKVIMKAFSELDYKSNENGMTVTLSDFQAKVLKDDK